MVINDRIYTQDWNGWHANCSCPQRRDTYERYYISIPKEYAAVIAEFVTMDRISIAEQLIGAWVVVHIDAQAKWRWGKKYNTHTFSPRSGKVTNPRVNEGVHRDLIDVQAPWCSEWYRILL